MASRSTKISGALTAVQALSALTPKSKPKSKRGKGPIALVVLLLGAAGGAVVALRSRAGSSDADIAAATAPISSGVGPVEPVPMPPAPPVPPSDAAEVTPATPLAPPIDPTPGGEFGVGLTSEAPIETATQFAGPDATVGSVTSGDETPAVEDPLTDAELDLAQTAAAVDAGEALDPELGATTTEPTALDVEAPNEGATGHDVPGPPTVVQPVIEVDSDEPNEGAPGDHPEPGERA